jgi:hypothetical protein
VVRSPWASGSVWQRLDVWTSRQRLARLANVWQTSGSRFGRGLRFYLGINCLKIALVILDFFREIMVSGGRRYTAAGHHYLGRPTDKGQALKMGALWTRFSFYETQIRLPGTRARLGTRRAPKGGGARGIPFPIEGVHFPLGVHVVGWVSRSPVWQKKQIPENHSPFRSWRKGRHAKPQAKWPQHCLLMIL